MRASVLLACTTILVLAGCQAPPSPSTSIDDLLHQVGSRHETFGPTGKRLFTERLEPGLGIRGQFCYINYADIRDPIHVTIRQNDQPLPVRIDRVDWYPSHLAVTSTVGPLAVTERKFITDDDTFVDLLTIRNDQAQPIEAGVRVASGFAAHLERGGSSFTTVDLTEIANAHPFPGRDVFTGRKPSRYRSWHEAEHLLSQSGSHGRDPKAAASGGECLGAGFGTTVSDKAAWLFATPPLKSANVYFRVARGKTETGGRPAEWDVQLDGKRIGAIHVPTSAGWGDAAGDFTWAHLPVGELLAGGHVLRVSAHRDANQTNFDGFYVSDAPFDPPAATDALAHDVLEQIPYRAARRDIDGVPFSFIDPDRNDGRGVVMVHAAPGPTPDVREVIIPIPGGSADMIHFCGQVSAGLDRVRPSAPVAEYELQFADGETERILLTAGDIARPAWAGPGVLAQALSPDRALLNVVFRCREGACVALAAITLEKFPHAGPNYRLVGSELLHGVRTHAMVAADASFQPRSNESSVSRRIRLQPGESLELPLALAIAEDLPSAEGTARRWQSDPDAFEAHKKRYLAWYDENCPSFDCDDDYISRLWHYRWFVARHCLSRAQTGNLREPCFLEGMHGFRRSLLSTHSSAHIIDETRWLRSPRLAFGQVRNLCAGTHPQYHYLQSLRAEAAAGSRTNAITSAAWNAFAVNPDTDFLRSTISALGGDCLGILRAFDENEDLLPARTQLSSGMDWQPSFFFFSDYDNTVPPARTERPEAAAFQYANASALSEMYKLLGVRDESARFATLARQTRDACLAKMWDDRDHFIYAVREDDDALARVREIVGFYPFATGLIPDSPRYMGAFEYLVDPAEFATPWPPSTVTQKCRAYTPRPNHWPTAGGRVGDRMWNGPTWPHACTIALNAAAAAVRDYRQTYLGAGQFWKLLDRYTHLQFEGDDLGRPMVRECYDARTATGAGCPDVFASTYNDLIIRCVVGIQPSHTDRLVLNPIPGPLRRFHLSRLRYRGHELEVLYNVADPQRLGGPRGLSVWVDGRPAVTGRPLGRLEISLPPAPRVSSR